MPKKNKVEEPPAPKKMRKSKKSTPPPRPPEEREEPKRHVRLWTGHCKEAGNSTQVARSHRTCPSVMETPTAFCHCPCPCHIPGVLDIIAEHEADRAAAAARKPVKAPKAPAKGKCPTCGLQGSKKKRSGEPIWKCESGHRWPRTI